MEHLTVIQKAAFSVEGKHPTTHQKIEEHLAVLSWEPWEASLHLSEYGGRYYLVLTKKEPREALYGVTTISFTGLGKKAFEDALEFALERLEEFKE